MLPQSTLAVFFAAVSAVAAVPAEKPFANVRFEENRGQTDASVRYLARASGQQVFLTRAGVVFSPANGPAIAMHFDGAGESRWQVDGLARDAISYYIGNDPSKWVQGAPVFQRVAWRNVYPGIDVAFHGNGDRLEYDLMLAAGADPSRVHIRFDAPARLRLVAGGVVEIQSGRNIIRQRAPEIWQESSSGGRRKVNGRFMLDGAKGLRLMLSDYERSKPVVVDPVLEASNYFGGENDDEVVAIADGVIVGNTRSLAFPGAGATLRTSRDVFVHGTSPVNLFSTQRNAYWGTVIIGGSGDDQVAGVVPTQYGFYIAGTTASSDFPTRSGQTPGKITYNGGASDGFIAWIELIQAGAGLGNINIGLLSAAGFVGGSGEDRINSFSGNSSMMAFAGVTDSPDLPASKGAQTALAGGKDAFYGIFAPLYYNVLFLSYLGGSGDDAAYAVSVSGLNAVWVGGSTSSADFPFGNGSLSGPSDGFLAVVRSPGAYIPLSSTISTAVYRVGGSGDDSVRAVVAAPYAPSVNVLGYYLAQAYAVDGIGFAGTTTSTDLPVQNAAQGQPGGAGDAMVGMLDATSGTTRWLTYLGGSGTDEISSIAQNWVGDLYVGGSTASTDLPVVNALQPANGGGQDGMFAVYDYTGGLQHLTYFGGSGDERIESTWMTSTSIAQIAGSTTSTDLPVAGTPQGPNGGMDGFIANIGTDYLIAPASIILAKDGVMSFSIAPGRTAFRAPVTYQSSDPSRVRLSYAGQSLGQVTAGANDIMQVEALSDSGEVDVTLSSPGFATKTIHVYLYPGVFVPQIGASISTWSGITGLYVAYCPIDPASNQFIGQCMGLRNGVPYPQQHWASSDSSILQITPNGSLSQVQGIASGTATVTFSVDGYNFVGGSQTVTVSTPVPGPPATDFHLGKDLSASLPFVFTANGSQVYLGFQGTLTVRSGDPSRLLLSLDPAAPGTDHVSVMMAGKQPVIYAQALAGDGPVQVFLSTSQSNGETPMNVILEPAVLHWGAYIPNTATFASSLSVTLGSSTPSGLALVLQGVSGAAGSLRPGAAAVTLTLANSNPSVLELNRLTVSFGGTSSYRVTGLAVGSSTLTLKASNPDIQIAPASLPVNVQAPVVTLPTLSANYYLGAGLQFNLNLNYAPSSPPAVVDVSVDDPSLVAVSSSVNSVGTGHISLTSPFTVYLQGLAGSGSTTLHVRFPEGAETAQVNLMPSGAGFSAGFSSVSFYTGFNYSANIAAYALDPATGIGISAQTPMPGPGITVDFSADTSVQFRQNSAVLSNINPTTTVDITTPPAGRQTTVTVSTEDNPSVSSLTATAKVGTAPPVGIGPQPIGQVLLARDELGQFNLNDFSLPATVTSSDPQNVLVSASATDAGSASIPLTAGMSSFYIHALGESGVYTLNFDDAAGSFIQVALQPLQLQIFEGSTLNTGGTSTYPASLNARALRPGVGPLNFTVQSSDPSVATITPAAFDIGGSSTFSGNLTVTGVSPGTVQITMTGPPNAHPVPPAFTVYVGSAAASLATYTMGVNMQGSAGINLGASFSNPDGAIVTLTTSDPSLLLLSRAATTAGSASVTVAVPAGSTVTQPVYLQGIAPGNVTLQVSANGSAPAAVASVVVVPSWVNCGATKLTLTTGSSQNVYCFGKFTTTVTALPQFQDVGPSAGLSDLTVGLATSDPDIFTVSPATQTLSSTTTGVAVKGVAAGTATLQVTPPAGFGPSPDGSETIVVSVVAPTLPLSGCASEMAVGQDTQVACLIALPSGTVTATSSDGSLLVVSASATAPGSVSASAASDGKSVLFTLQALAGAGTAEVVFHAPGYQDVRIAIAMRQTQIVLQPSTGSSTVSMNVGGSVGLGVSVRYSGVNVATLRAGASIPVDLSSDTAGIVSVTPAHIVLTSAQSSGSATLQAVAAGSTLVRAIVPAGYGVAGSPLAVGVSQ